MNSRAIGVFDSGVGGLSVLKHICAHLPHESLLYFADSSYAPYGNKTPEFIIERATYIADFLIKQGAKALVVACNTATAAAISHLRQQYALPIIGMEPAVKPAAAATKTGVVGVLATVGTLKSAQFAALLEHYGRSIQVVTQGCTGLVECVERGELNTKNTRALVKQYVEPLLEAKADTIVLGCTHYPFVRDLIEEVAGSGVVLIDTGSAVARHLRQRLDDAQLLNPVPNATSATGQVTIWTNNPESHAGAVIDRLWPEAKTLFVL
jgi:glutamate racemase